MLRDMIQVNIRKEYLTQLKNRVEKYKKKLNVRIPIYEEHAAIDFGRYVAVIREKKVWNQAFISENSPSGQSFGEGNRAIKDERIDIVNHIIHSLHDVEELLDSLEINELSMAVNEE